MIPYLSARAYRECPTKYCRKVSQSNEGCWRGLLMRMLFTVSRKARLLSPLSMDRIDSLSCRVSVRAKAFCRKEDSLKMDISKGVSGSGWKVKAPFFPEEQQDRRNKRMGIDRPFHDCMIQDNENPVSGNCFPSGEYNQGGAFADRKSV